VRRQQRVRVLYIVTAFPRFTGDVITPWLIETIHRLREVGVEVEVLAPSYRGLRSHTHAGIRVHRFRYAPRGLETLTHDQTAPDRIRERPSFLGLVPGYLAAGSWAAARLARSGRFDVVHAFWPIPHALLGMVAGWSSGVPLVSTFFGVELSWMRSDFPVLRPALQRIVQASGSVTAISAHTADALRQLVPAADPVLVPFGATTDLRLVSSPPPRPADRPYTVLFVGRLVERKGVAVLIEAMTHLRPRRPVVLEIVGDGPLGEPLRRRAAELGLGDAVCFNGFVEQEELSRRFVQADVVVLPAVYDAKGDTEGLGVVLIEALGVQTPVIASAVGGIPDIVRHEETGLLVPPGEPAALAAAIERYMDDPVLARDLAAAGLRHVERHFSWNAIVTRLRDLYEANVERSTAARAAGRGAAGSPNQPPTEIRNGE
jgi:glycosyltransferase involved in cell wall biosynthesis